MSNNKKIVQEDFLIVLDKKDIIQSVIPQQEGYQQYVNHHITDILDEEGISLYKAFKSKLKKTNVLLNHDMILMDNRHCYFNGYIDETSQFIIVLFESLSDQEIFKKIMQLNNQQLNTIRDLNKSVHSIDDEIYDQISRLNSELLNSRRIIEKQNAELQKYNKLLKQMSIEDSLTGCYNRRYFYEYMSESVLSSQKDDLKCIIMIDFNHFKTINDQFGHDAGDRLLVNFVKTSKETLNNDGEIFRLGGDEFILVTNHKTYDEAEQMMQFINKKFYEFSMISDLAYGIIIFKSSDINQLFELTNLMRKADDLMYQHKKSKA